MKVLLVGDYPPPTGGIAIHVQQLQRFLLNGGVRCRVLDIGKGGRPAPGVLAAGNRIGYAYRLLQFAARGWQTHLHVTGDNPKSWLVVASVVAAGRLFGRPALVTLHSGLVPGYLAQSRGRRRFARALLARCSRVIAVSEEIGVALRAADVPARLIAVYPAFLGSQLQPGPPPRNFAAVRASCRPLLAMADHPSSIYGRRDAFRALRLLARDFPGVGLALFGPGHRSEGVESDALAEGVRARVHDFGELDHSSTLGLISRCDAFLRPTTADGDSLSVREALYLGTRCVASDVSARPPGTVLFRGGDCQDLAEKIARALTEPSPLAGTVDVGSALLEEYQRACGPRRLGLSAGGSVGGGAIGGGAVGKTLQLGPH
jgi:glycosyltransferase involved in cell wall biosynthesis